MRIDSFHHKLDEKMILGGGFEEAGELRG